MRPNIRLRHRASPPTLTDARPTHLAPGRTLAQPATLLPPLVGSYPTVSALTLFGQVCFLLRL